MSGCSPLPREASLTLSLAQGDKTTYRWSSESIKGVDWEGLSQAQSGNIREGDNRYYTEMLYEQCIDQVHPDGSAVVTVRILRLKVLSTGLEASAMHFYSTRPEDQGHYLAGLVDRTYSLVLTDHGQVRDVNAGAVQDAVKEDGAARAVVFKLFSDDAIRTRHMIKAIPPGFARYTVGSTWHQEQSIEINMLGRRVFDKTYTLVSIKKGKGRPLAFVDMQAELISTVPDEKTEVFTRMFDTSDRYRGWMVFDMTAGTVRTYAEDLDIQWVAVNPSMEDSLDQDTEPLSITMTMSRHDRLERMD